VSYDLSNVRYISLIRLEGGESILNIPYAELTVDPDLIAGFVTAVIIFAKTPIRTIRKAAYDILIEVGETVLVLLVVDPVPNEEPYRKKLRAILKRVEEEHGDSLRKFEGDVRKFRDFALNVVVEFPFSVPDMELVPIRRKNGIKIPYRVGIVDRKLENLENYINGKRNIAEILGLIDLPDEEVIALISILKKYKWIDFRRRLRPSDLLERRNCPESLLMRLRQQYGSPVDDLLKAMNGDDSIEAVMAKLEGEPFGFDRNAIWFLINKLVEEGCLCLKGTL
jgi:hypothetical protein